MSKILVTGAAGFIGFHLCQRLLADGEEVIGVDNLNDYYDVQLKADRLARVTADARFEFKKLDIADRADMANLFRVGSFEIVYHLAAQAGVRHSIEHPQVYIDSNLVGFGNVLEGCRQGQVGHLVYASSSSVYGANTQMPFAVSQNVDHPISLYAATKKANELMAHSYSHLYDLPTTGLRFFTVYGPWGRPDMALYKFTEAILAGREIDVYNHGKMRRDFTYIDDIIEGVVRVGQRVPQAERSGAEQTSAPYRLYNIGNHQPVELSHFINVLEACLGRTAKQNLLPIQPGDVPQTYADIDDLRRDVGFAPRTSIEDGIEKFVAWYQSYRQSPGANG